MTSPRIFLLAICGLGFAAALSAGAWAATPPDDAAPADASRGTIDLDRAAPSAAPEHAQSGNPLWAIPLGSLSITRERPLFTPSRRPPAPPAVVVPRPVVQPRVIPPPAPEHPNLALIGTVVGDDEGIGVFLDQSTHAFIRIRTGEAHAGWILRSVKAREVTLEKGGRSETLSLPVHADAPAPSRPPDQL